MQLPHRTFLLPARGAVLAGVSGMLLAAAVACAGDQFPSHRSPTVTAAQVREMGCRYYTELLGIHSPASLAHQFDVLAGTAVDTVVCCASAWRFYNFPSQVDLTWRQPDRFPRDAAAFPNWRKMVDHLAAGGDPLRDALAATRALQKSFIVSFRMNDSHYVQREEFPTHNNFWRAHPEWRVGAAGGARAPAATDCVLDYLVPEVRDFYFAVLAEICSSYDIDGVELDFQRAPRFFPAGKIAEGQAVMTAHIRRIRTMLDEIGARRGRHLRLGIRTLHTLAATTAVGADVKAWSAAGWLDDIVVSPSYIQTADVGLEGFKAIAGKARVHGELNFVHLQLAGTGHNAEERRYVTAPTYRAATLSYLERGADGVSFFNTYCIPQPALNALKSELLVTFKDGAVLTRADKNYTSYATGSTIFGRVFPARDEREFQIFVADEIPGSCRAALLRVETKAACTNLHVEAWANGTRLDEVQREQVELFPALAVNAAAPKKENLRFYAVPVGLLKFGVNRLEVRNRDAARQHCDFTSAELGLYLHR